MRKIKLGIVIFVITFCGLALWPLREPVYAEPIPALKAIPTGLPKNVEERLTKRRQELEEKRKVFMDAAEKFNAKPAEQQSDVEYVMLQTQRSQYMSLAKAFNREIELEKQILGYKEALKRLQKTIEMGQKEMEEWTRKNEEAQEQALLAGAKLLFEGVASDMEKRINSARSFKGWLTRYEKAVKEGGVPFEVLQPKIEKAYQGYVNAMVIVKSGHALKKGLLVKDMWQLIRNEASVIAQQQAEADSAFREVLNDQRLKKFLETDNAKSEYVESLLIPLGKTKELEKIGPEMELAAFVVDYGYAATEWTASRNRIMQQWNLSDQELKAVNKLKGKIEDAEKELQRLRKGE